MPQSKELIAAWRTLRERTAAGIEASGGTWSAFFDRLHAASSSEPELVSFALGTCEITGVEGAGFGPGCTLHLSLAAATKVHNQSARLQIRRMGAIPEISDVHLYIGDFSNKLTVVVGSSGSVFCGDLGAVVLEVSLGNAGSLIVGDKTTVNGAKVVAINSRVSLQRDVMVSDEVLIQGFDQHGIVDLATGEFVNLERNSVSVGKHAWIARRATLLPGAVVGEGSIVGACSVVTREVPPCSLVAGVPARVLRQNVSWSRSWKQLDAESEAFIEDLRKRGAET